MLGKFYAFFYYAPINVSALIRHNGSCLLGYQKLPIHHNGLMDSPSLQLHYKACYNGFAVSCHAILAGQQYM